MVIGRGKFMHTNPKAWLKEDLNNFSMEEILNKIINLSNDTLKFWQDLRGWAPESVANLLEVARLDWLIDLTYCLKIWIDKGGPLTQGELLLARANLGALVEGWLKLFYCVYYEDYIRDEDAIRNKQGKLVEPNKIKFEQLKNFSRGRLWEKDNSWFNWVGDIQNKRNAIHAFNHRDIGNEEDLLIDIRLYYNFILMIDNRLPYPYW